MANHPNNAFPAVMRGGRRGAQVLVGNNTLRAILGPAEKHLDKSIREIEDEISSNDRYLDRLARNIESGEFREAEVTHLRQRMRDIGAETANLRAKILELGENRRVVHDSIRMLEDNPGYL